MSFSANLQEQAAAWLKKRGITPPADFMDKAELFHDLIQTWSFRMNIVAKGDLKEILEKHILDSIEPAESIPDSGELLDIGSGGGFPAIPIALLRPRLHVTLLESKHKKILFLKEAERHLELPNITIVETRLEDFAPEVKYDLATIRALPDWEKYLTKIKSLLRPGGGIIYYEKRGVWRMMK